jgi:hypothetical protein
MVFSFFGLKKKPVIEDVEAKVPTLAAKPALMTFDEALAAQAAAEERVAVSAAPLAAVEPEAAPAPEPAPVSAQVEPVAPEPVAPAAVLAEPVAAPVVAAEVPSAPVAAPATPAAEPEEAGQMGTMKATREDVIAAYKIFLGRLPESMEVVDPRVGQPVAAVLVDFMASKEFLDQAPKSQLVLAVAKKILDERKQAAVAECAAPAEQGQPAV